MSLVEEAVSSMKADIKNVFEKKRERLRNVDFFILDNSIRESTVGQLRGHTLQNKQKIYKQVKACLIDSVIVASFSHMTRVDDQFCQWLKDEGEDFDKLFSFSEVSEGLRDGVYDMETVPISLRKNRQYGIYNTILEVDLANPDCKWDTEFTLDDMFQLIEKWMNWVYDNINEKARIFVNLRDIPLAMNVAPQRLLKVVEFLSSMPPSKRIKTIVFEDPLGESLPEEMEAWTASVRKVMNGCGWEDGRILVHVHQKWDLQTAVSLDCIGAGANGVWASLCEEGAAMGHSCSSVVLMNMIRLGNTKVLDTYNCKEFRKAAINVTKITTGRAPHPKQVVYGERAIDLVFGPGPMSAGGFNIADFFEVKTVNRITTLASDGMVVDRLVTFFGEDQQFTLEIAKKMKAKMLEDLRADPPRKEEYMSAVGIATLFDRAGGKMTAKMSEAIAAVKVKEHHHKKIIAEIRELWDMWDAIELHQRDNCLQFDSFYHGFLAPYFGCYRCQDTKAALRGLDMDNDGFIDWNEFMVYIKWALHQYPDVENADQVISIAFEKGIVPAMRDEKERNPDSHEGYRHSGRPN